MNKELDELYQAREQFLAESKEKEIGLLRIQRDKEHRENKEYFESQIKGKVFHTLKSSHNSSKGEFYIYKPLTYEETSNWNYVSGFAIILRRAFDETINHISISHINTGFDDFKKEYVELTEQSLNEYKSLIESRLELFNSIFNG